MGLVRSAAAASLAVLIAACGTSAPAGGGDVAALALVFSEPVGFAAGRGASNVRLADLDCDGDLDMSVFCPGDTSVAVLTGGDGGNNLNWAFGGASHTLVWDSAADFCLADMDGDGLLDLVVCGGDPVLGVAVFLRVRGGSGAVGAPKPSFASKRYASVAAGDVNGDGLADVVAHDGAGGTIDVLLNDRLDPGTLTVAGTLDVSGGGALRGLAVGDVDRDGGLDVVTVQGDAAATVLLWNTVTGQSFSSSTGGLAGAILSSLEDLDGDGGLDLAIVGTLSGVPVGRALLWDAATPGSFSPATPFGLIAPPEAVTIADVNRDGVPDVAVAVRDAFGNARLELRLGDRATASGFEAVAAVLELGYRGGVNVAAGDVNADGFVDFVLTDSTRDVCDVLARAGAPPAPVAFSALVTEISFPAAWLDVATGDVDGDGKADLVGCDGETISCCLRDSARPRQFSEPNVLAMGLRGASRIALADVDGDGRLDVAFSGEALRAVGVLWQSAVTRGAFDPPAIVGVPSPRGIAVGDLDGDGRLDLATTSDAGGAGGDVVVVLQDPLAARTLSVAGSFTVGASDSRDLHLADFDCDGRLDVAVANGDDTLSVLLHGPGAPPTPLFLSPQVVAFAGGVHVAAGDLDGDGSAEIVAGDLTGVTLSSRLPETGAWVFGRKLPVAAVVKGDPDRPIILGDLDRDGLLDVVAGGADGDGFRVLRNDPFEADGFRTYVVQYQESDLDFLALAVGDLDGDGWTDVVTSSGAPPGASGGRLVVRFAVPGPR